MRTIIEEKENIKISVIQKRRSDSEKDRKRAEQHLKKALQLKPDFPEGKRLLATMDKSLSEMIIDFC